jgi:hypothetical protein
MKDEIECDKMNLKYKSKGQKIVNMRKQAKNSTILVLK